MTKKETFKLGSSLWQNKYVFQKNRVSWYLLRHTKINFWILFWIPFWNLLLDPLLDPLLNHLLKLLFDPAKDFNLKPFFEPFFEPFFGCPWLFSTVLRLSSEVAHVWSVTTLKIPARTHTHFRSLFAHIITWCDQNIWKHQIWKSSSIQKKSIIKYFS